MTCALPGVSAVAVNSRPVIPALRVAFWSRRCTAAVPSARGAVLLLVPVCFLPRPALAAAMRTGPAPAGLAARSWVRLEGLGQATERSSRAFFACWAFFALPIATRSRAALAPGSVMALTLQTRGLGTSGRPSASAAVATGVSPPAGTDRATTSAPMRGMRPRTTARGDGRPPSADGRFHRTRKGRGTDTSSLGYGRPGLAACWYGDGRPGSLSRGATHDRAW